jgi:Na+-transporting NADH:ubiquinone oxidoreductase subunit E
MNLFTLFISGMLINNIILSKFIGMCPFMGVSTKMESAVGMGLAVIFVLVVTLPINYLLNEYVLKPDALIEGVDLSFLSFIIFIAVIAAIVQIVEMVVEKYSPSLYASLGIFLPLIAVNCAILGGSLFMQQRDFAGLGEATVYALGSGRGWFLAIVSLAAIREKLQYSNVPAPLKGLGITCITVGLMGIAFMTFMGISL